MTWQQVVADSPYLTALVLCVVAVSVTEMFSKCFTALLNAIKSTQDNQGK